MPIDIDGLGPIYPKNILDNAMVFVVVLITLIWRSLENKIMR